MTDVKTVRQEYSDLLIDVTRNRAAVSGERSVKKGRTRFLPPLASMCVTSSYTDDTLHISQSCNLTHEGTASYNKYLSLAYFYGATGRTVDGLTGLIFSKKPTQNIPNIIDYVNDNIDGKGNSLRKQSQNVVIESFITPQSGLLVDFPKVHERLSIAEAEKINLRPKILHYKFESIINWFYDIVNNEQKLTLLVLKESAAQLKNTFEVDSSACHYRVLQLIDGVYYQSVYNDNGELISPPEIVLVNGNESNEIPFYWIKIGSENKSIINDLVDANFNHYKFFADYAAKEHASAFPIFTETGSQPDDQNVLVGPGMKWTNRSAEAEFGVLQTESDGGSMRQYLLDMEQRMAALGAEMLKPRIASAESAEAKSLDQVAQNSTVGNVAINVSEAYVKALQFATLWMGSNEIVEYELNLDYFPKTLDPQLLTGMIGAVQSGLMSYQTFYENLLKGEIANPVRTAEDEKTLISTDDNGM